MTEKPNKAQNPIDRELLDDAIQEKPRRRSRSFLRGFVRFLIMAVVVLAALVLTAPLIMSSAAVRNIVVNKINAEMPDSYVEIGNWRWRWRSPCGLENLVVKMRDGSFSCAVDSVSISEGILSWLRPPRRFGSISVNSPAVTLSASALPEGGVKRATIPSSESKRIPESTSTAPAQPSGEATAKEGDYSSFLDLFGKLVVVNGSVEAHVEGSPSVSIGGIGAEVTFDGYEGKLDVSVEGGLPKIEGAESVGSDKFSAKANVASLRNLIDDPKAAAFETDIVVPPVDLAALDAFLPIDEVRPRITTGNADFRLKVNRADKSNFKLKGTLSTSGVRFEGGALGNDKPEWDAATVDVDMLLGADAVEINALSLDSPFAIMKASGKLIGLAQGDSPDGMLAAKGELDIAAVAAQLPETLKLREGIELQKAVVLFDAEAAGQNGGAKLFALLRSDGAEAMLNGKPLKIDLPVSLGFTGNVSKAREIESAVITFSSEPATLAVEGNLEKGDVNGSADLGAVHAALGQVLDLGAEPKAIGKLDMRGGWTGSDGGIAVNVRIDGKDVKVAGEKPLEFATCSVDASALFPTLDFTSVKQLKVAAEVPFAKAAFNADEIRWESMAFNGIAGEVDAELAPLMKLTGVEEENAFADRLKATVSGATFENDDLTVDAFSVEAGPAAVKGAGKVKGLQTERQASASGVLDLDLDTTQALLDKRGIKDVRAAGKSSRPFKVFLPLGDGTRYMLANMEVEAGLSVNTLEAAGMAIEGADMSVVAGDGKLDLRAAGTLNEGSVNAAPTVDLLEEPPIMTLPIDSLVLKDAKITQDFLQQQLSRVHPILRSCAVLSGRISIGLEEFAVPLSENIAQGMEWKAAANLRDTRLEASGVLEDIAGALGLKHKEVTITNQTMRVACKGGRLFPDPLDLVIDDEELRISGSVGLDGSLDYIVDVKLSEKMVGSSAYNYLKGRSVRLPVSGTAKSPRINSRALRDEVQRLVAGVATQVTTEKITEELGDKLKGKVKQEDLKKLEDALKNIRL